MLSGHHSLFWTKMWSLLWSIWLFHGATPNQSPGGRSRLSLIQMILLTHLKVGFEKEGRPGIGSRYDWLLAHLHA
tara:strand:- start:607 stop:831 length:225 start_codon:yes stop_codon:yes gene_type:complete